MESDIRKDFPIFADSRYVYLDNAATSQRPRQVMEAAERFYSSTNANPLRGLYEWSILATDAYEEARRITADFLGGVRPEEVIFTRNTTESLNLAAMSYGRHFIKAGDEIVIPVSEHHSNILPWQAVARETGARLVYLECEEDGTYTKEELRSKIGPKTALVAMAQVSNVLGRENPVKTAARLAHENGAVMVVDGAQSAPHMAVSVKELGADFFAFSGHKMLGPMGIGVLWGRKDLLDKMPPFLTGGEMIEYVTRTEATYAELPHKFEAGTVNAAGAVGLAAAIRYLTEAGFGWIRAREEELTALLMEEMSRIPYLTIYGSCDPAEHNGIVSFNLEGCHPHDVASLLDAKHICIRAGHHCAQPLMQYLGINASCRASLYFYNTEEEILRFTDALKKVRSELGYRDGGVSGRPAV